MASITNIDATDLITDSRADINNNFANLNADKIETSTLDTDTTLAANSDSKIATQKAVKAYVDTGGNVNATETTKGIVEIATQAEVDAGTDTGGTGATLVVTPSQIQGKDTVRTIYAQADSPATWTKGSGLVRARVQVWGAGGSGGYLVGGNDRASGGGGGAYLEEWIEASALGENETVTIGAGGASVSGTGSSVGNDGEASSFGAHLVADFGNAGANNDPGGDGGRVAFTDGTGATDSVNGGNSVFGGGGGGYYSSDGLTSRKAGGSVYGGGGGGAAHTETGFGSSSGGSSQYGGSGGSGDVDSPADAGTVPAGGGGGSVYSSGTAVSGAGGDGQVIVTEYYV